VPYLLEVSLPVQPNAGQQQQQQSEPGTAFCYRMSSAPLPWLHAADACIELIAHVCCDGLLRCLSTVCDWEASDLLVI
jgi:hypothetical protein